uniref:tRNA-intron lyase n=1 Tax=Syphacia muris TaxID=451379 RepID=A0A0N5AWQ2_9BILA
MDSLRFDKKRFRSQVVSDSCGIEAGEIIEGVIFGDVVVIRDPVKAAKVRAFGFYGNFLNERSPEVAVECFHSSSNADIDGTISSAIEWNKRQSCDSSLYLSMEECMYLAFDLRILQVIENNIRSSKLWMYFVNLYGQFFIQRYAVYRYLRHDGWVVRSGLLYGVDFLIYYQSPCNYHSSAGVRILSDVNSNLDNKFIALNRQLNNVKKSLIYMIVEIPRNVNLNKVECLEKIVVTHMTYHYRRL